MHVPSGASWLSCSSLPNSFNAQGATSWWLGYWADHSGDSEEGIPDTTSKSDIVQGTEGIGIYALLSLGAIFITVGSSFASTLASQRSSRSFHEQLVAGVVRAPMVSKHALALAHAHAYTHRREESG